MQSSSKVIGMAINLDFKDSSKHTRFVEFRESKFYANDFKSWYLKYLTIYDESHDVLYELAHVVDKGNNHRWITSNDEILRCTDVVSLLVESCKEHGELYLDVYIEDIFKPNPSLTSKRIFTYRMTMGKTVQGNRGGSHKGGLEQLYNLESISAVDTFSSVSQLMAEH